MDQFESGEGGEEGKEEYEPWGSVSDDFEMAKEGKGKAGKEVDGRENGARGVAEVPQREAGESGAGGRRFRANPSEAVALNLR